MAAADDGVGLLGLLWLGVDCQMSGGGVIVVGGGGGAVAVVPVNE